MPAACARIALAAAIKSAFGYRRPRPVSMHDSGYGPAWLELLKRFSPLAATILPDIRQAPSIAAKPRRAACRAAPCQPRDNPATSCLYTKLAFLSYRRGQNVQGKFQRMRSINRRMMLAGSSAAALLCHMPAWAQTAPKDT